jgi:hypothetical protein
LADTRTRTQLRYLTFIQQIQYRQAINQRDAGKSQENIVIPELAQDRLRVFQTSWSASNQHCLH